MDITCIIVEVASTVPAYDRKQGKAPVFLEAAMQQFPHNLRLKDE
jgi:hypothetical protein